MNKMCNMSVQDQMRLVQVSRWNTVPVTRGQSVAEHSWVVAVLYREYLIRAGHDIHRIDTGTVQAMYHDVTESIIGDIPTPTKSFLGESFRKMENMLQIPYDMTAHERGALKVCDLLESLWYLDMYGVGKHAEMVQDGISKRMNKLISSHPDKFIMINLIGDVLAGELSI